MASHWRPCSSSTLTLPSFRKVTVSPDRVAVMLNGELVEVGTSQSVLTRPQHPYSRRLLAAAPSPDPDEQQRRRAARAALALAPAFEAARG